MTEHTVPDVVMTSPSGVVMAFQAASSANGQAFAPALEVIGAQIADDIAQAVVSFKNASGDELQTFTFSNVEAGDTLSVTVPTADNISLT
jgi:hypothetical protein